MTPRNGAQWTPRGPAVRGLAWLVSAAAGVLALGVGVIIALIFAASMVVIGAMALLFLIAAAAGLRARQSVRSASADDIIEARHVGGHSWVAYGLDEKP